MTLLHEAEVIADIATAYRTELDAMTGLHDAVVGMISAGQWKIGRRRGLDRLVVETMMGLLTKATKTFRSIQILCEHGLPDDANALVRVLMENMVAIAFILQRKSRERVTIYHAYTLAQQIKMLNDWKSIPGLKRKVTKQEFKQANQALAKWTKGLPTGTDFKHHWSGKPNLREAMKALSLEKLYATLYRFTSPIAHASDFFGHVQIDPASGDRTWEIEPTNKGFKAPSYMARQLLWGAANRIDQRLGLGFSAALAPHKPQFPATSHTETRGAGT